MTSGCGEQVTVCYYEGELKRFVTGRIIEENNYFLTLDLNKYVLRIAIPQIIKIETAKRRGMQ